jgi:pimeloyl-ACP methyl ester carboxylesterase
MGYFRLRSDAVNTRLDTPEMRFRTIDGLSIRFAEGGGPGSFLLSPWPETLALEPTWSWFAKQARVVAIDLPGFGHTERRNELMSQRALRKFLVRVADKFRLESPHVFGPDIGTEASLFAAAMHPGRLRSLAVGCGAAAVPLQLGGLFKDCVEAPDLEGLGEADPRQVVEPALADIERPLPDRIREDYISAYQGNRLVESMR